MGKGIVKLGEGQWAVKDGNLLAAKETNGRFKNAEFTVARGTDATYVGKDGLIANETGDNTPRIDFTDNTDGHLLLEPQSTNLITYSEDLIQIFGGPDFTPTYPYDISPDGTQSSTRLQLSNLGNSRFFYSTSGIVTSGQSYTFSCYYKGTSSQTVYIKALVTGGTDVIKEITLNGNWQREDITFTAGSSTGFVYIVDSREGGTATDFEVWGAQLEELSYATSLIPTNGSTVTRDADTCTGAGEAADFNSSEGVLYAEIAALANDGTWREINLDDGSTNNAVEIRYKTTANQFQFVVRNGGTAVVAPTVTISNPTEFMKVAFSYKTDDCKMYINGVEVATDTSGTMPSGLNHLSFDWGGTNPFRGKCKAIRVYKEALSDSELVTLTS